MYLKRVAATSTTIANGAVNLFFERKEEIFVV
jgi:hypothetical protein